MKKFLALLLVCVMAFAIVSCGNNGGDSDSVFADFEKAIEQTPASKVRVDTKITTELGILHSTVETTFNPNGSASVYFYIQRFNSDFTSSDVFITKSGTVTLNADGSYSDGGDFADTLGSNIASVSLDLDEAKLESYSIEGGVLSASVKAENTAAVLGTEIGYDVDFMLTVGNGRIVYLVINYTSDNGPIEAIVSYN
jgi:hypothetical protein